MFIIITKNGKAMEAFYKPGQSGYIELEYNSLVAQAFMCQGVRA